MLRAEPSAADLEAYFQLTPEQIAQIVLLLLLEEGARDRLRAVLSGTEQLPPQPLQSGKKLLLAGDHVAAIRDVPR
jgi:hypothetical protein